MATGGHKKFSGDFSFDNPTPPLVQYRAPKRAADSSISRLLTRAVAVPASQCCMFRFRSNAKQRSSVRRTQRSFSNVKGCFCMERILVIGATGNVRRQVASQLLATNVGVRA